MLEGIRKHDCVVKKTCIYIYILILNIYREREREFENLHETLRDLLLNQVQGLLPTFAFSPVKSVQWLRITVPKKHIMHRFQTMV